jgi:TetR/AcrR family transcriptional repressor of nem operon
MSNTGIDGSRLTRKGQATMTRIVEIAADLVFERGVAGTGIDDVRKAAGVSGSQMTHYFTDKRSLIRAVIAWQANATIAVHQLPELGELDSFEALDLWAELNIARQKQLECQGGCRLGSLAGELVEQDSETRADLAAGFERWEGLFRHGLRLMKQRGELQPGANTDELALNLLAALQGGMLLTQTMRNTRPLEVALKSAIAYTRSFATDEAERANTKRKPATSRRASRLVASL